MPAADDLLIEPSSAQASRYKAAAPGEQVDFAAWLHWLAELLPAVRCMALVRVGDSSTPSTIGCHPQSAQLPKVAKALAYRACQQGSHQRLLTKAPNEQLLALPILQDGDTARASTALLLVSDPLSEQQQGAMLGLTNWALRSLFWVETRGADDPRMPGLCNTPAMLGPGDIQNLLDQLSLRFDGAQCAWTWMKRQRRGSYKAHVVAMSGQPRIDRSRAVVRGLAMLMEGALTKTSQEPVPVYETDCSAQKRSNGSGLGRVQYPIRFIVPIKVRNEVFLFSLFQSSDQPLSNTTREQLVQELVPAFQSACLLRELEAPLHEITWRRCASRFDRRNYRKSAMLVQLTLLAVVLTLVLYPVEKRVSAEVNVEAAERHALIASTDGFVQSIHARAGDHVAQGDLLATLDDEDLLRQADKWIAEEQKNQQDYLSALAVHDRVELSTLRESRILIQTELEQVRAQLHRHELRAPIAGIVLSDSIEDALGSAVKAGQILFEVGSAEQYRLALQVPERRIGEVAAGQGVTLRMTADPKQRRQASVEMVIPIATASQGQNTFKVYALPDDQGAILRPGMKGIGKVLVGRASRLSQWAGSLWARCVWLAWKLGMSS